MEEGADSRNTNAAISIGQRGRSLERLGGWVALLFGLSVLQAALFVNPFRMTSLISDRRVFGWLYGAWQLSTVSLLPLIAVVAIVPPCLPQRRASRWPWLGLTVVVAAALGWAARYTWLPFACGCQLLPSSQLMSSKWSWAFAHDDLVIAAILTIVIEFRRASMAAHALLFRGRLARLEVDREVAAALLQLLQAQVEPHFLFNTLANVRRLLQVDRPLGRSMLADLVRYLESALPRLREDAPTLACEVEVIRAYLGVHQVRMGSRLHVDFDVPHELGPRTVPPMMLLTLVENALKHGLQPLQEGGSIRVVARANLRALRVDVADTGRGLGSDIGTGTGLVNIRTRLRAMYGADAALSLRVNQPRGVVASIEFPSAP